MIKKSNIKKPLGIKSPSQFHVNEWEKLIKQQKEKEVQTNEQR